MDEGEVYRELLDSLDKKIEEEKEAKERAQEEIRKRDGKRNTL